MPQGRIDPHHQRNQVHLHQEWEEACLEQRSRSKIKRDRYDNNDNDPSFPNELLQPCRKLQRHFLRGLAEVKGESTDFKEFKH
jgi:hypothetical protein